MVRPGIGRRIGMAVQLVEAVASRDAAEQGVARLGGDPEQMRERGEDGDDDAAQHAEAEHAHHADEGEEELDAAELPEQTESLERR